MKRISGSSTRNRPSGLRHGASEVDESALRVGMDESYPYPVADIETRGALFHAAFDRGVEDAHPGTLGGGAGDDAVELLAEPSIENARCRGLAQQTLDLL